MKRIKLLTLLFILLATPVLPIGEGFSFLGIRTKSRLVFGGPFLEFSTVNKDMLTLHGGQGAFGIGKRYFVGLYGLNTLSDITRDMGDVIGDAKLRFAHAGIWNGFMCQVNKNMFTSFSLKSGLGSLSLFQDKYTTYNHKPEISVNELAKQKVVVFTPSLDAGFRIFKWLSFSTSVGYRFVLGNSSEYLDPREFNKPVITASLMLGSFGYN